MEFDLHNNMNAVLALSNVDVDDGDTDTDGVDTLQFGSLEWIIGTGLLVTGAWTLTLQESDDDAVSDPYTDVPAELVLGGPITFGLTEDNVVKRIGSIGKKRFQRVRLTGSGNAVGFFRVDAILANPRSAPVDGDEDVTP